uniref:SMC hinge domain-containing protein n=1 Tax=Denticeps clupeoides TaxID=299321 RepID=A0AAY4CFA2_9TELE
MGYLKQLDVENFKSWEGKQIIGPFMRFNCIIGTNGSGKSNLMDALGFVMGERASSLRVKHLRDLIHGAHIGRPASTSASVTMRYCDEHGGELRFSRTVSGDSSDFYINGKHVTLSIYTVELEKIGIVVKARNCLVFQVCSVDLAEEYNTKHAALMKAKEETQFNFNRKRSAVAERKQIFKDKTEAVKYQALLNELGQSKLQLSLFRMYHTEQRVFKLFSCIREKQEDVTAKMRSVEKWEQLVKVQKKENGRLNREMQQTEKEIRVQEQNLSHQRTQYIKAKVNTSHHERKAEANRASLHESYKQREQKKQDLTELHKDLDDLERAWKAYAREMEVHRATQEVDVHLEEAQLERYRMLKESATRQAAGLRQQAEKLRWQVKADQEKLEVDKRRKYEVEVSIKNGQTQLEDCTKRAEKLKEYFIAVASCCSASLEELRQREHSLMEELEQGKDRRQQVNKELCEVLGALQNARLDSHESHRQRKRQEAVESLRRQYPDTLIGRLVDLCQPIHKKFQLAITKVFGHHMNAIVVTSEKVACECIKFLKQERAEPETFLPIDYLDVTPLNERLREIRGTKLVVDVVQCATQLKKVVQYVCGNALVCETIKEARHVAFDGPARLKTVSLDGTMFSKSGVISGGSLHLRSKACRWDEKDMNELRERKERLTVELRDLMNLRQKEAELSQTRVQIQGIQTRLKYSMTELDSLHKRTIPACQAEISRLMSELELVKLQKEMISLEAALEQRRLIKHNLLQECKIDNIPITLLSGSLDDISDALDEDGDVEKEAQNDNEIEISAIIEMTTFVPFFETLASPLYAAFEASTSVAKKCNQEFEQVKAKRFRMFSDCFDHVSVVIDQIYKKLCRNQSAQAMLSPENPDEPYLGGINYNCVAPGKRFMAMDNLSGGEKTIAALALVFAIHSFRPAPFFVLDEVDAALDNSNIGKVTGFIREQSTQNVQVIVISLKEEFYSRSDVLLGVYSECMYSRLLSVDLRPYPLHEEDAKETDQDT